LPPIFIFTAGLGFTAIGPGTREGWLFLGGGAFLGTPIGIWEG